jgi:thymidylate synthase (FAD)
MRLVRESVELSLLGKPLDENSEVILGQFLESCGRVCYKSEPKTTEDSYKTFLKRIIGSGHESILEHANVSAKLVMNRGVSHELVRHRIGVAISQESTRYCNYSGNRFGSELTFIIPAWVPDLDISEIKQSVPGNGIVCSNRPAYRWFKTLEFVEKEYFNLLSDGWTPEKAREILPNSLATSMAFTCNIRAWRHILAQRLSPQCHPQMRLLMSLIGIQFIEYLPLFFEDILKDILSFSTP